MLQLVLSYSFTCQCTMFVLSLTVHTLRQVNMATLQTTNVSERCDALATASATNVETICKMPIVCSVSLFWDPTIWLDLFSVSVPATTPSLPVAGYYCAEVCAKFPTPTGYRMQDCQFVDVDECAAARITNVPICAARAACINRKPQQNSLTAENHQDTLNSTGYMCICQAGYFTTGIAQTACKGKGLDVTFFMTETGNVDVAGNANSSTNSNNNSRVSASAISVFYTFKTAR